MKDGSYPEIKLFIPAGNYNLPQHLLEQIYSANRVQIRFSKSLGEIFELNLDLSNKLIGNDNQVFTYAVDLNMTHHQSDDCLF